MLHLTMNTWNTYQLCLNVIQLCDMGAPSSLGNAVNGINRHLSTEVTGVIGSCVLLFPKG